MEKQTELSAYFDIFPFLFKENILIMLKKFQVEAFPYDN